MTPARSAQDNDLRRLLRDIKGTGASPFFDGDGPFVTCPRRLADEGLWRLAVAEHDLFPTIDQVRTSGVFAFASIVAWAQLPSGEVGHRLVGGRYDAVRPTARRRRSTPTGFDVLRNNARTVLANKRDDVFVSVVQQYVKQQKDNGVDDLEAHTIVRVGALRETLAEVLAPLVNDGAIRGFVGLDTSQPELRLDVLYRSAYPAGPKNPGVGVNGSPSAVITEYVESDLQVTRQMAYGERTGLFERQWQSDRYVPPGQRASVLSTYAKLHEDYPACCIDIIARPDDRITFADTVVASLAYGPQMAPTETLSKRFTDGAVIFPTSLSPVLAELESEIGEELIEKTYADLGVAPTAR